MYSVKAVVPLSPRAALSQVEEAKLAAEVVATAWPELTELIASLQHPSLHDTGEDDPSERFATILLQDLAERMAVFAEFILSNHVAASGNDGLRFRFEVKCLVDLIGQCATRVGEYARLNPADTIALTGILFEYNWRQVGQRLIDEHDKRNISDGDELS